MPDEEWKGSEDKCLGIDANDRKTAEGLRVQTSHLLAMLDNEGMCCERQGRIGRGDSDLSTLFLDPIKDCSKR